MLLRLLGDEEGERDEEYLLEYRLGLDLDLDLETLRFLLDDLWCDFLCLRGEGDLDLEGEREGECLEREERVDLRGEGLLECLLLRLCLRGEFEREDSLGSEFLVISH